MRLFLSSEALPHLKNHSLNYQKTQLVIMMDQMPSNETVVYATFTQRICAFIIDYMIFLPLTLLSNFNTTSVKSLTLSVLIPIIWCIYKPVMEWKRGATLGKMALKIRVVDESLQAISFNQASLRFLPYFAISLSVLFATFVLFRTNGFYEAHTFEAFQLLEREAPRIDTIQLTFFFFIFSCSSILLDEKNQAVHDRISRTYCIVSKP